MISTDLKQLDLPDTPGVYRFVDAKGGILYIGRATSLRDRTKSYFSKDLIEERGVQFVDMVVLAKTIEWTETDSVLEAILLESELIKKYQPHYNIKERDDKSYYMVVITDEEFPRVLLERSRNLKQQGKVPYKTLYTFGPFPSGPIIREALRLLRKIFPFRDGKSRNEHHDRFYRQLGLSPDANSQDAKTAYTETINHLTYIFRGKKRELVKRLTEQMKQSAKDLHFESAGRLRNTIYALDHIKDVSLIKSESLIRSVKGFRIESYDIAHISGSSMVGVMTVVENGEPQKSEYRKFHIRGISTSNDTGALAQVITRRFKHSEWRSPDLIVVDGGIGQLRVVHGVCAVLGLDAIPVVSVVKDDKHNPRDILGKHPDIIKHWKSAILLSNAEAHRYAIGFHRQTRRKKLII